MMLQSVAGHFLPISRTPTPYFLECFSHIMIKFLGLVRRAEMINIIMYKCREASYTSLSPVTLKGFQNDYMA